MKKYTGILFFLFTILLVCSCTTHTITIPKYEYEKDAIWLRLKADPQLHLYQGSPHTLVVCAYQLKEPNAFNQLINDNKGLAKLLKCERFDPSVASFSRIIIHPGEKITKLFDRAEGAKYLAIVAGYYYFKKDNMTRLIEVPIITEKTGWIKRTEISKPGPIDIYLYLGPEEMRKWEGE